MTAEIAILNKSAVALAADSAVTISAASAQQKIYDSADKLFELSLKDPIAIMVNGDMQFAQIPIDVIIKKYRETCKNFEHVKDAAPAFLECLSEYGENAPDEVKDQYIRQALLPMLELIRDRSNESFIDQITNKTPDDDEFPGDILTLRKNIIETKLSAMKALVEKLSDADFFGIGDFTPTERNISVIQDSISDVFSSSEIETDKVVELCVIMLRKTGGHATTGVVVSGFGSEDLFPTLMHYEVYGIFGDRLKYKVVSDIDIDRSGPSAKVIPFAQKEMVERFLYGLDGGIRRNITDFCKTALPSIRENILSLLDIDDHSFAELEESARAAEEAFVDGLSNDSFDAIRSQSQAEIEDMVEFMPKPEMARMAEALVNLTSIKRRVSRGMETVGGPIDVAVISRADGFVWVQRKHYFPSELNSRYFNRKRCFIEHGENQ